MFSALPLKADMTLRTRYIRFVPKPEVGGPHSITSSRSWVMLPIGCAGDVDQDLAALEQMGDGFLDFRHRIKPRRRERAAPRRRREARLRSALGGSSTYDRRGPGRSL